MYEKTERVGEHCCLQMAQVDEQTRLMMDDKVVREEQDNWKYRDAFLLLAMS